MRFRRLMRVIVLMFAAACSRATVYVPLTHWACSHPSGWGVWLTKCLRFSRLLHYSWGTGACVRQTFFTLALLIIHAAALTSTAGRPRRCWVLLSNQGLILGPSRSSIDIPTSVGRRSRKMGMLYSKPIEEDVFEKWFMGYFVTADDKISKVWSRGFLRL